MASVAQRGPINLLLKNPAAQWMTFIGMGASYCCPDVLKDAAVRALQVAAAVAAPQQASHSSMAPIVVHVPHSSGGGGGGGGSAPTTLVGQVGAFTVAVAGCTVAYVVVTTVNSPLASWLPATQRALSTASRNLATSLVNVKESLQARLELLQEGQEKLSNKQDETHHAVEQVGADVENLRTGILQEILDDTVDCKSTLLEHSALHAYTERRDGSYQQPHASFVGTDQRSLTRELEDYLRHRPLNSSSVNNRDTSRVNKTLTAKTSTTQRHSPRPALVGPEDERPQKVVRESLVVMSNDNEDALDDIQQGRYMSPRPREFLVQT